MEGPLTGEELRLLDAYWRAANYVSVGQIYLLDNPLLREPLRLEHVKPRLLGHWGTTPGLNFLYAHMNGAINARDLNAIFVTGPGHGGPALVANAYLEGTYSEVYPHIGRDEEGLRRLFRQFSFPGGIPSHVAPETPGSIHEGGELGYALVHAFGAAFDNPDLLVCCVVGDGEAETGPLAASWHSNKFLNPERDGVVLPILHLNGYKIANPTVLARIPDEELRDLMRGYGYEPYFVEGDEPEERTSDGRDARRGAGQRSPRSASHGDERPRWPMIVLRTPKGWTGPKEVDGLPAEGSFRSHQVPLAQLADRPEHLAQLESWLRSYRPEELFDEHGALLEELAALAPRGERRMGANPHANGGLVLRDLDLPDFRDYAVDVPAPAQTRARRRACSARSSATSCAATRRRSASSARTRRRRTGSGPCSRRPTARGSPSASPPTTISRRTGACMEVLSEHLCQGWLEGYLLTGRHGLFNCYEAFIHIIDSMFNQHAKWLKVTRDIPWRRPIASLNYLLTSHVWRQDHNGFSHQDPGFIDHVVNKKAEIIRVYLPPDANTLLSVADHCLRSQDYVNVIVAGKQPALDYLTMDEAILHCTTGIGIWDWASNDEGGRARRRARVRGRRPDARDARRRAADPQSPPRAQGARRERRRPDAPSARQRASARALGRRVRRALHDGPPGRLRVPRLSLAHPPAHVPAHEPREHPRARLQGGGDDDDAVRHGDAERHGPLPSRDRRDRPRPRPRSACRALRQHMAEERLRHRAYTREVGDDMPDVRDWSWEEAGSASVETLTPELPG